MTSCERAERLAYMLRGPSGVLTSMRTYIDELTKEIDAAVAEATHGETKEYADGFKAGRIVGASDERKACVAFINGSFAHYHGSDLAPRIERGDHVQPEPKPRYTYRHATWTDYFVSSTAFRSEWQVLDDKGNVVKRFENIEDCKDECDRLNGGAA